MKTSFKTIFFNSVSALQRVVLGEVFIWCMKKGVHLITVCFINVLFIEIFYKGLTVNQSVYEGTVSLKEMSAL